MALADLHSDAHQVRHAQLAWTMLRYRVASLLLPFFLMAPAFHGLLHEFRWQYIAGVIALGGSYVVATCLNDVFDFDVDRINHPGAPDRPLVSGAATPRQLIAVALVAAVVALIAGTSIGLVGAALVALSLLLNVAYSAPPIRLCARALAAPIVLAFAYVVLPYGIGLAASGLPVSQLDVRVAACFVVLFVGRMLLKDFRDRRGDAAFGKRTFLLAYGKSSTLALTLGCIVVGDGLLVSVAPANPWLILVLESYFAGIALQLYRLWAADEALAERLAIALGARMGNAVVLTLLGFLLLSASGSPAAEQAAFVVAVGGMFWFAFAYLTMRQREGVLAGYRG
jgi:4-hydroxybenzoate polyprenyltransferase